jgi:ribosomal protein L15
VRGLGRKSGSRGDTSGKGQRGQGEKKELAHRANPSAIAAVSVRWLG